MGDIDFVSVGRGTDAVLVSFHGAVSRQDTYVPRYGYKGHLWQRNESFICVSDPTLTMNDTLTLAWYVGTARRDVHAEVADLVQLEAAKLGAKSIVFLGSSGGGFAAMAVAARVPGSTAVAFSPSLAINRVSDAHTANFMAAAFPQYTTYQDLFAEHPERVSMDHVYGNHPDVDLYLIQNSGDQSRIDHSYSPFAREHRSHGCYTLAQEHHGAGHIAPPPERFHYWLDTAVSNRDIQLAS